MEEEILRLINNKVQKEDRNRLIEANIKLVDKNKYLIEDLKILSKFIRRYLTEEQLNDEVKRIINNYVEEK